MSKLAHKNKSFSPTTSQLSPLKTRDREFNLQDSIAESWKPIAPFWPLKNLIAVNPLQGFEDMPFEDALVAGESFFEQKQIPKLMESVNRETIKWLQVFFDEGLSTIQMPFRRQGLYGACLNLIIHDKKIHRGDSQKEAWIKELPKCPNQTIKKCLSALNIATEDIQLFLTLTLTTLPGWAAHIKYRTQWENDTNQHPVTQEDYLAFRLVMIYLICPKANAILDWHKNHNTQLKTSSRMEAIESAEKQYSRDLINQLLLQKIEKIHTGGAQLIFCIDVRSEPIRRAIEEQGDYSTFGFAGFFGIPVQIENKIRGESYASCPVLLQPEHTIDSLSNCKKQVLNKYSKGHRKLTAFQRSYESLKYNFLTPFALVESIGFAAGIWMGLKTFFPRLAFSLQKRIKQKNHCEISPSPSIDSIEFKDQCKYAKNALEMIGLTDNFSPLVVFCGHGSKTENNAYSSILDCGACGGHNGCTNAQLLVNILNRPDIRSYLAEEGIKIPSSTLFLAGLHNTTTDSVELIVSDEIDPIFNNKIEKLKKDLVAAQNRNSKERAKKMSANPSQLEAHKHTFIRSVDWTQTRPEWGLAQNASFIAAPRELTKHLNLDGRAFLHSYRPHQDVSGSILTSILTAPMVVAQWINSQYLFSSMDNVAYGSGSKITKNISGKVGVMQGNASDLMHGLPLQSIYLDDETLFHTPVRLLTVIYAPPNRVLKIIQEQKVLKKFATNGWVHFNCIDPNTGLSYILDRNLHWT